jgi:hypothetical protein
VSVFGDVDGEDEPAPMDTSYNEAEAAAPPAAKLPRNKQPETTTVEYGKIHQQGKVLDQAAGIVKYGKIPQQGKVLFQAMAVLPSSLRVSAVTLRLTRLARWLGTGALRRARLKILYVMPLTCLVVRRKGKRLAILELTQQVCCPLLVEWRAQVIRNSIPYVAQQNLQLNRRRENHPVAFVDP